MEFAFTRASKLLSAVEFSQVFDHSCCKAGDNAFLILAAENRQPSARLGLVIAKRQLKRAVERNRVKRIARESFRHWQQQLAGVDLVVLCRHGAAGLDKAQIRRKLDRLFDKIAGLHNR
jgi:ribonuclease P protein component